MGKVCFNFTSVSQVFDTLLCYFIEPSTLKHLLRSNDSEIVTDIFQLQLQLAMKEIWHQGGHVNVDRASVYIYDSIE